MNISNFAAMGHVLLPTLKIVILLNYYKKLIVNLIFAKPAVNCTSKIFTSFVCKIRVHPNLSQKI